MVVEQKLLLTQIKDFIFRSKLTAKRNCPISKLHGPHPLIHPSLVL